MNYFTKISLILSLSTISLLSETRITNPCNVDFKVLRVIAKAERSYERPLWYPYIISFNNYNSNKILSKKYKYIKLDRQNRVIDCLNTLNCVNILKSIISKGENNIDVGNYQFNYIYFKFPHSDYFNNEDSFLHACNRVQELFDQYGVSWKTVAKYHSKTPKYNKKYQKTIFKILKRENNEI